MSEPTAGAFRLRLALLVYCALQAVSSAAHAAAGRGASGGEGGRAAPVAQPEVDLAQPADSSDFMQAITADLDSVYDQYLAFKEKIQNDHNIQYSMPVSVFGQWGTPKSGPGVAEIVYSPTVTWTPFTDTAMGSGAFTFSFLGNQFWTHANTNSQQVSMGLLTTPNDWATNGYQYSQITYTQTFPGNWLAVTVGQYSFALYDGNQYAGDVQTNFINYALAQNGTQRYANAGTGAYVQIMPNSALEFAGGLQSATDITGHALTTNGFGDGKIAYGLFAQWKPTYLAGGAYSILYYDQPAVPQQPSTSQGLSFNAVQNLNARYGLFLRANNASGAASAIETSVAFGGIVKNPFGRNRLDQAGIGLAWDKTNTSVAPTPARGSEWVGELYYNYTVFKAMQLTPDVQLYVNPALAPNTNVAAVFSLRATFKNY
jgi:Carbohydrate-selective porin, OprB family